MALVGGGGTDGQERQDGDLINLTSPFVEKKLMRKTDYCFQLLAQN
jgi:hypothetical protein